MKLYRLMKKEIIDNKPKANESASTLGARPDKDIVLDNNSYVYPMTGGMSVSRENFEGIPAERLARWESGESKEVMFQIEELDLPSLLIIRPIGDINNHYAIEPSIKCKFSEYQKELHYTRPNWFVF